LLASYTHSEVAFSIPHRPAYFVGHSFFLESMVLKALLAVSKPK